MNRKMLLLAASSVCWIATVVPASAQQFKQITGSLAQVAAGQSEVWGLDPGHQVYRFDPSTAAFAKAPGTLALTQIAVGGGTALQKDQVWGLTSAGKIYKFNFKTNTFVHIAGTLAQIVVGEGYQDNCHPYEVWGLDAGQLIYRYDACSSKFVVIPGALTHIATGGGDVWGLNGAAQIYHYAFHALSPGFYQVGQGSLQQIAVGVNDVWGLDGAGRAWRYDFAQRDFAVVGVFGATQIYAGGNGIWALKAGLSYRYNPDGEEFEQKSPSLIQIAVGSGAGVWGVNNIFQVFSFVRP